MKPTTLLLTFSTLLILTACGQDKPTATEAPTTSSNPLQHQVEALEKAKNLEADMQKSLDDRLNAIDDQK